MCPNQARCCCPNRLPAGSWAINLWMRRLPSSSTNGSLFQVLRRGWSRGWSGSCCFGLDWLAATGSGTPGNPLCPGGGTAIRSAPTPLPMQYLFSHTGPGSQAGLGEEPNTVSLGWLMVWGQDTSYTLQDVRQARPWHAACPWPTLHQLAACPSGVYLPGRPQQPRLRHRARHCDRPGEGWAAAGGALSLPLPLLPNLLNPCNSCSRLHPPTGTLQPSRQNDRDSVLTYLDSDGQIESMTGRRRPNHAGGCQSASAPCNCLAMPQRT